MGTLKILKILKKKITGLKINRKTLKPEVSAPEA